MEKQVMSDIPAAQFFFAVFFSFSLLSLSFLLVYMAGFEDDRGVLEGG